MSVSSSPRRRHLITSRSLFGSEGRAGTPGQSASGLPSHRLRASGLSEPQAIATPLCGFSGACWTVALLWSLLLLERPSAPQGARALASQAPASYWACRDRLEGICLGRAARRECCWFRAVLRAGAPMPKKWDRRYIRLGPNHGEEVILVESSGLASVWTCLRPNQTISTVKLSGKDGSTTQPKAGVAYRPTAIPTAQAKAAVEQRSASLKAEGVAAPALVGWSQPKQLTKVKRALWIAFSVPALGVALCSWLTGAWYRPVFLVGSVAVFYKLAAMVGLPGAVRSLFCQGMALLHVLHDVLYTVSDTYVVMSEFLDGVNERLGTEFTVVGLLLALGVCWVSIFWLVMSWDDICLECTRLWGDSPSPGSPASPSGAASSVGTPPEPTVSAGPHAQPVPPSPAAVPPFDSERLYSALEKLARTQAQLAGQVEDLAEERRVAKARKAAEDFASTLDRAEPPPPPPPASYSQEDMDALKQQVAELKAVVERDRSAAPVRAVARAAPETPEDPPGGSATAIERGRDRPAESQEGSRQRENSVPEDKDISDLLLRCERAGRSTSDLWARCLRQFRRIKPEEWRMPADFKERLAPEFLSGIYVGNARFADTARRFILEHGLEDCLYARGLRDAAEAIDAAVLDDATPDLVNQVFLELLVRQAYSIMMGFDKCRVKSDWLKPKTNQGSWRSKVDFDLIARLNPRAGDARRELLKGAEGEIKASMTRDALWAKARQEHSGQQQDFLNS